MRPFWPKSLLYAKASHVTEFAERRTAAPLVVRSLKNALHSPAPGAGAGQPLIVRFCRSTLSLRSYGLRTLRSETRAARQPGRRRARHRVVFPVQANGGRTAVRS